MFHHKKLRRAQNQSSLPHETTPPPNLLNQCHPLIFNVYEPQTYMCIVNKLVYRIYGGMYSAALARYNTNGLPSTVVGLLSKQICSAPTVFGLLKLCFSLQYSFAFQSTSLASTTLFQHLYTNQRLQDEIFAHLQYSFQIRSYEKPFFIPCN